MTSGVKLRVRRLRGRRVSKENTFPLKGRKGDLSSQAGTPVCFSRTETPALTMKTGQAKLCVPLLKVG